MNVSDGPSQDTPSLVNVGVTSIVATTGVVPVLIATKEEISPEPVSYTHLTLPTKA